MDKVGTDLLANVGTVNVARDLERLREALGDEKLTYLGYSYGTLIGSAYAEAYPDKVRAMTWSSTAPSTPTPIRSSPTSTVRPPSRRPSTTTPPTAPRTRTARWAPIPRKPLRSIRNSSTCWVTTPAKTGDPRARGSYGDAITGTITAMYAPSLWKHLTTGLKELAKGRGDTLLLLADSYWDRDEQGRQ